MKFSYFINSIVYNAPQPQISVVFSQISEAVHTQETIPLGVIRQTINKL